MITRAELVPLLADLVDKGHLTLEEAQFFLAQYDAGELTALPRSVVPLRQDDRSWELALAVLLVLLRGGATDDLSEAEGKRARKALRTKFEMAVQGLAFAVNTGGILIDVWQAGMANEINTYAQQMTVAGAGKLPNAATRAIVAERVQAQQAYLKRFGTTILARNTVQRPMPVVGITSRSRQYGAVGWGSYFMGYGMESAPGYVERWVTKDDGKVCVRCGRRHNKTYLVGHGPMPGWDCYGNCRCERVREYNAATYNRLIRNPGAAEEVQPLTAPGETLDKRFFPQTLGPTQPQQPPVRVTVPRRTVPINSPINSPTPPLDNEPILRAPKPQPVNPPPTMNAADITALATSQKPLRDGLTDLDQWTLDNTVTRKNYDPVDDFLRNGTIGQYQSERDMRNHVYRMDKMLSRTALEKPTLVFKAGTLGGDLKVGDVVLDKGYGRASMWPSIATPSVKAGNDSILNITLPQGHQGLLLDPITGKKDWEVLLPRNMELRITGVTAKRIEGKTMTFYDAELIPAAPIKPLDQLSRAEAQARYDELNNLGYWTLSPEDQELMIRLYNRVQEAGYIAEREAAIVGFTTDVGRDVRLRLLAIEEESLLKRAELGRRIDELQEAQGKHLDIPYTMRLEEARAIYAGNSDELRRLFVEYDAAARKKYHYFEPLRLAEGERSSLKPIFEGLPLDDTTRKKMENGYDFVNNITVGANVEVPVEIMPAYTRAYAKGSKIYLATTDGTTVTAHELGHFIERQRSRRHAHIRQDFFNRRTAGDQVEKLADIYPGQGYEDSEVVKRDQWGTIYSGKIYGGGTPGYTDSSSEIISMGIQHLYEDPLAFARKDPDFFDFVVSYLREP